MLNIRKATEEDTEAIWCIHTRAIREIAGSHYTFEETEAWAGPRRPEQYVESIRCKEFYVAEEDGAVVGFGTLDRETCEVEAVYVSPDVVRHGVGSSVLRALEERARALALETLHLDASLNAVEFYEQAGYKLERRTKHSLASGVEIACALMTKRLLGD